jgi:ferredoxin
MSGYCKHNVHWTCYPCALCQKEDKEYYRTQLQAVEADRDGLKERVEELEAKVSTVKSNDGLKWW